MSPTRPHDALVREALRLHARYQREVIERFSICPWAKQARIDSRIRAHVVTEPKCEAVELKPLVDAWAEDAIVDVVFIIAPRFAGDAAELGDWAATIGALADWAFFSASFFPRAPASAGTIAFLRQTPDPTVQLVRRKTLESVRAQDPPHYKDIFDLDMRDLQAEEPPRAVATAVLAHAEQTIAREGRATLQSILDDIRNDRDTTYARLEKRGLSPF